VEEIAISKFKARCLAILERVRTTKRPIRITRFGQPVAEVVPPSPDAASERVLGALSNTGKIVGDIVAPASDEDSWEALR
jgi:prevent-host-death family protein